MQDLNTEHSPPCEATMNLSGERVLWRQWSLESTLPKRKDFDLMAAGLNPGTRVYLSALPRVPFSDQLEAAIEVRRKGLEPVPHISARRLSGADELADYLAMARGEAGVERVLVIGGDIPRPRGPYTSSLDLIGDDMFLASGIKEVGIAGYPEGHPLIDSATIDAFLERKIRTLSLAGLQIEIVSQFCFNAGSIADWHDRLRRRGIVCPIRIGLAGPVNAATLIKLALRCGVNLPLRSSGKAAQLLRGHDFGTVARELEAGGIGAKNDGRTHLHVYSFGGTERTIDWARSMSAQD